MCKPLHHTTSGAALVEFALVLPILMLLFAMIADLGMAGYQLRLVQAAAEAGAQYADSHSWDPNAIAAVVTGSSGVGGITATPAPAQVCGCPDGGTLTPTSCGGSCPSGIPAGVYALVTASRTYATVLPYPWLPSPLTLTGKAYRKLR